MRNIPNEQTDYETAKWLYSIGYRERTHFRYSKTKFEVCDRTRIQDCSEGELLAHSDCVYSTDFIDKAIPAPSLQNAADFIQKVSGISLMMCKNDNGLKFYCRVVAYGSIILKESGLYISSDDAIRELIRNQSFRKCIENELNKKYANFQRR